MPLAAPDGGVVGMVTNWAPFKAVEVEVNENLDARRRRRQITKAKPTRIITTASPPMTPPTIVPTEVCEDDALGVALGIGAPVRSDVTSNI